jgi:hypothetical protein
MYVLGPVGIGKGDGNKAFGGKYNPSIGVPAKATPYRVGEVYATNGHKVSKAFP